MTERGYRDADPVIARIEALEASTAKLVESVDNYDRVLTSHRSDIDGIFGRLRSLNGNAITKTISWFASPLIVLACFYGISIPIQSCNAGARDERRAAVEDAAAQLHANERYCAAVGLRYAGTTPIVAGHQVDARGYPAPDLVYQSIVCGNGHGDGMFVGGDGLLRALKASH